MADQTEKLTVEFEAKTSDLNTLIAGLQTLKAEEKALTDSFAKTNAQYERGLKELAALQQQEKLLNAEREKHKNDAAVTGAYNKALESTAQKIAAIRNQYSAELQIIGQLKAKQDELKVAMDKAADPTRVKWMTQELHNAANATARLESGTQNVATGMFSLSSAIKAAGAILAAEFAVSKVRQFGEAVVTTTADMQGLRKAIDFISNGRGEFVFTELEKQAEKFGLQLGAVATGYKVFSASIGDKMPIEQSLKIFEQINMALSVMKVPTDKAANAYNALAQMMSKGTVMSEELKGQLGDALPGALGFAAKAMGVTEKAFLKMMEKGEVMASDFLPKFAQVLEEKFAGGMEDAADSIQGSINRTDTAWIQMRETIGNLVMPAFLAVSKATVDYLGILAALIQGQQLTVEQTARMTSTMNSMKTVLSVVIGLFFTMTAAGRAFLASTIANVRGLGTFTAALYSTVTGAKVSEAGVNSLNAATKRYNATVTILRGLLAGLAIGAAIAFFSKLYDIITKTDVGAERLADNMNRFHEAMDEGMQGVDVEVGKLRGLFEILKDTTASEEDRARALTAINGIQLQYNQGLLSEAASLGQITAAEKLLIDEMEKRLKLKVAQEIYFEQLKKVASATTALAVAQQKVKDLQVNSPDGFFAHAQDFFQYWFTDDGWLNNITAAKDDVARLQADIQAGNMSAAELVKKYTKAQLLLPSASGMVASPDFSGLSDKQKKAIQDMLNEEERLRKRLAQLNQDELEDNIETLTAKKLARLRFNRDMEIAEMNSLQARLAAEGKLTDRSIDYIKQIKEALVRLYDREVLNNLLDSELANNEKRTQALIAEIQQSFIDGHIKSEADMQADIAAITFEGEKRKLAIIDKYGNSTVEQQAKIQATLLKNTQERIEREKRAEQAAFDARQQFLQGGDYAMQEEALQRHFARMRTIQAAENVRNGVAGPKGGLTADQDVNLERQKIAALRELDQQRIKDLRASGKTRQQIILETGQSIRELEVQQIREHYQRLNDLATKEAQVQLAMLRELSEARAKEIAIEAAKEEVIRARAMAEGPEKQAALLAATAKYDAARAQSGVEAKGKLIAEAEARIADMRVANEKKADDEIYKLRMARAQQDLGTLQKGISDLEAAGQSAASIQQQQAQAQIDAETKKYDKAIELQRIKADKDARFYGAESKQAKKSAADLAHLEEEKQYRIQAAQEQAAKRAEKIAIFNKALQVANATIATAQAIIGYLAMVPITPVNIGLSIAAGIAGALQVAAIIAAPIPKFAEGTPSVQGGTAGRDSVHALLMPGERVVPTAQNQEYWGALEAIRTRRIPAATLNGFAMNFGAMASGPPINGAQREVAVPVPVFDDSRLVEAIRTKEHVSIHFSADEAGFALHTQRQNSRIRHIDKRLSFKG